MLDVPEDSKVDGLLAIVRRIASQHDIKATIGPADSLVDCGFSSMAMVDVMLAVEVEFDIMIPQRELTPINFESVETLARMLQRI